MLPVWRADPKVKREQPTEQSPTETDDQPVSPPLQLGELRLGIKLVDFELVDVVS